MGDYRHDPRVVGAMAGHVVLPWSHRAFSLLKRWALGTYHGLRRKHVDTYLNEFVFRYNRRFYRHASFETLLGLASNHVPTTYWDIINRENPRKPSAKALPPSLPHIDVPESNGISLYQNTLINPSAGNVGIGTTNPVYTLQVAGSVAGSSAYVNTSDERYKKNIAPLQFGLDEIEQLQPVTFQWKDPRDPGMEGQQIGFIAQDVEKILPSVVLTEDNPEKTKAMKYSEIIPVLVKAMQEQQTKIDEQQKEIDALKQTAKQGAGAQ